MSSEDVSKYLKEKEEAFLMFDSATMDYVVSRCSVLNGLPYGLILSSQAVEKILKLYLVLKGKNLKDLKNKHSHKITSIAKEAMGYGELDLSKYKEIIDKLEKVYENRYPISETSAHPMRVSYLKEVDELFIYMMENLPIPDEVKFSCGIYPRLFGINPSTFKAVFNKSSQEANWIFKHNHALIVKMINLKNKYEEVTNHFLKNSK